MSELMENENTEDGTSLSELEILRRENDELRNLAERFKLEAQCHALEARSANSTVAEIYRIISGARGEPGNWNGAEPVREYVEQLMVDASNHAADAEIVRREREFERQRADFLYDQTMEKEAELKRLRDKELLIRSALHE